MTATSVGAWNALIEDFDDLNDTLEGTTKHYSDDDKSVALEEVLESHDAEVWNKFGLEKSKLETADAIAGTTSSMLELTNEAATLALSIFEAKRQREEQLDG